MYESDGDSLRLHLTRMTIAFADGVVNTQLSPIFNFRKNSARKLVTKSCEASSVPWRRRKNCCERGAGVAAGLYKRWTRRAGLDVRRETQAVRRNT